MTPRQYQIQAFNDIKKAFADGYKNIAIALCGGSGKSLLAKMILDSAKNKGSKIGFFSYRKILIDQIKTYNIPNCDVGTLQKFGKEKTELYDLVIIDESWGENSKLRNNINSRYTITLSGTPVSPDGFALSNYDYIVEGIQYPDLVELGYAKKTTVLSMSKVNTSKLKKQNGDYSISESFDLMSKSEIHKDIVGKYKQYATNRKVMLFAVNTKHAEKIKEDFLEAGISADTIHSKKSDADILERFDNGEIKVLISISKLNVGYDNPSVNCIMLCRPTKSIPLFMQTIWRGTRIDNNNPDSDCLILDLANCIQDTIHPMQKLNFTKTKKDKFHKCPKCKNKMKLLNRKVENMSEVEYVIISEYECDECGTKDITENYKVINQEICEGCGDTFKSVGGLQLEKADKNMTFNLVCECGHKKKFRELLYSNEELKEVELKQALEMGGTWKDVEIILKAECKKAGYKWQYSNRLIGSLQAKQIDVKTAIAHIKRIKMQGKKISMLMYV